MKASEVKLSYKRESTGIMISCSRDSETAFRDYWDVDSLDHYETFVVMFLSRSNEVLGIMKVAEGSLDACLVDARKIFQGALLTNSSSIILAHNHPSSNLRASQADLKITKEIQQASSFLKISLLDHIILTSESYMSLADEGMI
jgi:DNA repair protein RadC